MSLKARTFVALVALALGGCAGKGDKDDGLKYCSLKMDGDILIGEFLPFSGSLASFGPYLDYAVIQAIDEINQAGGINGQSLGYVQCNSFGEATFAIEAFSELLANFDTHAMVGPVMSPNTVAIADLAVEYEYVIVSPVAIVDTISYLDDHGYIFRTCATASMALPPLVEVMREKGIQTTLMIHQDNIYGNTTFGLFRDMFAEIGGTADHVSYQEATPNYAESVAEQAMASFPPDGPEVVLMVTWVDDGAAIMRATSAWPNGPDGPQFAIFNGKNHPEYIRQTGGIEEFIGTWGALPTHANNEDYDCFACRFEELWGIAPFDYSHNAYDAVYLVAMALALADDPNDGVQIRDALASTHSGAIVHPQQWARALELVADGEMDYQGAAGPQDFDENGDVLQNVETWYVNEQGEFESRCWKPDLTPCD